MTTARRPVFFTSIPKCGKNLVYSFYFALGMKRWAWGDKPAILHAAHFARLTDKQNYCFAQTGPVSDAAERTVLSDVAGQIAALPDGVVAHHHFLPAPRLTGIIAELGLSAVFVMRDPRDALVSMLNFARAKRLPHHVAAMIEPLSDEDALLFLIDGGEQLTPFADYYNAYAGWRAASGVTCVRFEDLVGQRGGGDAARQQRVCGALAALAGLSPDDESVNAAMQRVFNPQAGTFFKGHIGAWRAAFTPAVARAYERRAGWLGPQWGYADDGGAM